MPNAIKLAQAFSLDKEFGTDEMIYSTSFDFLHNFQIQVGAMKRFSSWEFDDQEKRNIAQAIEKRHLLPVLSNLKTNDWTDYRKVI